MRALRTCLSVAVACGLALTLVSGCAPVKKITQYVQNATVAANEAKNERLTHEIEQETATLGARVPWAGAWSVYTFMGPKNLRLAPRSGWIASYGTCMGSGTNGFGRIEERGAVIHLIGADWNTPSPLLLAHYDGKPRLLSVDSRAGYQDSILNGERGGTEGTRDLGYAPLGAYRSPAGGTWEVPEEWRAQIDGSPTGAQVVAGGALYHAQAPLGDVEHQAILVDVGRAEGAWKGQRLHSSSCTGSSCSQIRLVRVGEHTSEAVHYRRSKEVPIKVLQRGDLLSDACGKSPE